MLRSVIGPTEQLTIAEYLFRIQPKCYVCIGPDFKTLRRGEADYNPSDRRPRTNFPTACRRIDEQKASDPELGPIFILYQGSWVRSPHMEDIISYWVMAGFVEREGDAIIQTRRGKAALKKLIEKYQIPDTGANA